MRILFVSSFLPGANVDHAGGRDIFHLMRYLSKKHSVSIVCMAKSDEASQWADDLRQFCEQVQIVPTKNRFVISPHQWVRYIHLPRSVGMSWSSEMRDRLDSLLKTGSYDLVQYENVQMIPYSDGNKIPGVLDCIDVGFLPLFQQILGEKGTWLRRLYWLTEWPRLQLYESRGLLRFNSILVRSEKDASIVRILHPNAQVVVMQSWPYTTPLTEDPTRVKPRPRPFKPVVMFVGAMWRPVNADACIYFLEQVWPLVKQEIPDAQFWIVGGRPPARLIEWNGKANVLVTGYVTDLLPYYKQCSVAVAPLLAAGGVIAKIADAMRIGIPVVATSAANQGTEAKPGCDILIGDDPVTFARHLISILQDETLYRFLSENAERFVETKFDWNRSVKSIEELYERTISQ